MSEELRDSADLPSLSNAEWEIMKVLWQKGPMAARDVYAALPEGHGWAYKTVKTLLARLVKKEAVEYEQVGNSYLYRAACSREKVTDQEIKSFLDRVLDGSLTSFLSYFVKDANLSKKEINRIRGILEEKDSAGGEDNPQK
ncbi:BlaI/MecI/CopY family transcriptional regulator [bacterium]|nr:BlaI/MecI/CopY family transcriptional regulator [bacterium]